MTGLIANLFKPMKIQEYRRAGQRCFGLLALINRPQVRYIHLLEQMILPGLETNK